MLGLIQRVKKAKVTVNGELIGEIGQGLLLFLAIELKDEKKDVEKLIDKVIQLRVFENVEGKLDKSLLDLNLNLLIVSQFTLAANTEKGRRPSFENAMKPKEAEMLYNYALAYAKKSPLNIQSGVFQANMQVELVNDGPLTMMLNV